MSFICLTSVLELELIVMFDPRVVVWFKFVFVYPLLNLLFCLYRSMVEFYYYLDLLTIFKWLFDCFYSLWKLLMFGMVLCWIVKLVSGLFSTSKLAVLFILLVITWSFDIFFNESFLFWITWLDIWV